MKKGKKIPLLKNRKHDSIVDDFKISKEKHLEKLATKMLKKDEEFNKLKEKKINTNFLNLF
tara:strand:- start:442 stop:624 length:183 start_codon:yes stop_codon:yes gene_type:complete